MILISKVFACSSLDDLNIITAQVLKEIQFESLQQHILINELTIIASTFWHTIDYKNRVVATERIIIHPKLCISPKGMLHDNDGFLYSDKTFRDHFYYYEILHSYGIFQPITTKQEHTI